MRYPLIVLFSACSVTPITPKVLSKGELRTEHADCPAAASVFQAGGDDDGDGTLTAAEVESTVVLCVGADQCTVEMQTSEAVVTCESYAPVRVAIAPGSLAVVGDASACTQGGVKVDLGLDNGDGGGVARDGVLQDGEIDSTQSVCAAGCGDGTTDAGEECDDGNTMDGDLCDHVCRAVPECPGDPECPVSLTYFVDHFELPTDRPTAGGFTVTLHGIFPSGDATVDIAATTTRTEDTISFTSPAGAGIQPFSLSVGGTAILGLNKKIGADGKFSISYDAPLTYGFNTPTLTGVEGCDASGCPRAGGVPLTIFGQNFGADASVRVGGATCEPITIVGEQLTCPLPPGVNAASVSLTIRGLAAASEAEVEYVRPQVLTISGSSVAAGQVLTISGQNFGSAVQVSYGGDDGKRFTCANPAVNDDEITCTAGNNVGRNLRFVVKEAGGPSESRPYVSALTYTAPIITPNSFRDAGGNPQSTITITGGQRIAFTAENIGDDAKWVRVTYGDYECSDVQIDASGSPTAVSCRTAFGSGSHALTIYGGDQEATEDMFLNYPVSPGITSIQGCAVGGNDCPTAGRVALTITGENFIEPAYATVGDQLCGGSVLSAQTFVCELPPGTGYQNVRMFSAGNLSNTTPLSYAAPSILTISGCSFGNAGCATLGGDILTISGQNFGASNARVLVGDKTCANATGAGEDPHGRLTCTLPPGSGQNLPVRVVNGRVSEPYYLSYE